MWWVCVCVWVVDRFLWVWICLFFLLYFYVTIVLECLIQMFKTNNNGKPQNSSRWCLLIHKSSFRCILMSIKHARQNTKFNLNISLCIYKKQGCRLLYTLYWSLLSCEPKYLTQFSLILCCCCFFLYCFIRNAEKWLNNYSSPQ